MQILFIGIVQILLSMNNRHNPKKKINIHNGKNLIKFFQYSLFHRLSGL